LAQVSPIGKAAEHWFQIDTLTMFEQLGLRVVPRPDCSHPPQALEVKGGDEKSSAPRSPRIRGVRSAGREAHTTMLGQIAVRPPSTASTAPLM
jgi:hypothetical protein